MADIKKYTFINALRNFVIAIVLICILIAVCLHVASIIFLSWVYSIDTVLEKELLFSLSAFDYLLYYFSWYIENIDKISFSTSDYFIVKLFVSIITPISLVTVIIILKREKINEMRPFKEDQSLHGDARWATDSDIKSAGLRSKMGMILGKHNDYYLVADGYQHALLFAPTGSGKGVGFVIPNMLFWDHSAIVHDIKLEIYNATSGYRASKLKQKCFVWSPADVNGKTHCYNPLDWISDKPGQMVDDVQKIGNLIMEEKEFWNNEARSLFVGVTLYLCSAKDKIQSFGEVVRTMRTDDVVYNLAVVLDTMGNEIHPVAYMNIAAFLQKADKERSGVISTMNSSLELWANPLIDTATASSDFDIQQFKKDKTTVYIGLTPDNIQRLQPLMKVFYQQATEFLSRRLPTKDEPYGVMFLMDEFPTLGKMEQFMSGIAFFRGYNVRLFLVIPRYRAIKRCIRRSWYEFFLIKFYVSYYVCC